MICLLFYISHDLDRRQPVETSANPYEEVSANLCPCETLLEKGEEPLICLKGVRRGFKLRVLLTFLRCL